MGSYLAVLVAVLLAVAAVAGVLLYFFVLPHPTQSENWAGYSDERSVGSASGSIAIPASSDWHGSGVASLWVGMGGYARPGASEWPFWQAGVLVTCSSGVCTIKLFDEGGTQGAPCNGVCSPDWTQSVGFGSSTTVTVSISGGSTGAVATFSVDQNGVVTHYTPPPWTVLAGVTSFPTAEWIFESPEGPHGTDVMPTLNPPGALFSSLSDSAGLAAMSTITMQGNPNGQSVSLSSLSGGSFSAYSYNT